MEHKPEDVARQLDILDRLVDYGDSRVMHFNKCNDVWITEHSNAVIDIKVVNGMIDSKVKGNLTGIVLACADIVRIGCEQANKDPKDVLETIGELIDIADVQKR